MVISFIYPNSEKGQYPDGTRLNIYDIASERVLASAVYEYNKAVGYEDLTISEAQRIISVTEYVPPSLQEKIETARSSGQDYSYFANEFYVKCVALNKFDISDYRHLFGILPKVNNKVFAEKLYSSYKSYLMTEHAEMNIIPRMAANINYEAYDYLEIANVFENSINMNVKYLEAKNSQNGSFVSSKTGATFNDLISEMQSFQNLQIQNFKAFISSSKLAKNPAEYVNKLRAENESYRLEYNRLQGESDVAKRAMDQYDHTFEENIIVTGIDEEHGLYQSRPKTAYDTVTKRALDKGVEAKNILKDMEENERLIWIYSSTNLSPEESTRLSKVADSMVEEIKVLNNSLFEKANNTVEDFLSQKSSDYARLKMRGKSFLTVGLLVNSIIVFVFGVIIALILAVSKDLWNKNKKRRQRAKENNEKQRKQLDMLASLKKGQKLSDILGQYLTDDEPEGREEDMK